MHEAMKCLNKVNGIRESRLDASISAPIGQARKQLVEFDRHITALSGLAANSSSSTCTDDQKQAIEQALEELRTRLQDDDILRRAVLTRTGVSNDDTPVAPATPAVPASADSGPSASGASGSLLDDYADPSNEPSDYTAGDD